MWAFRDVIDGVSRRFVEVMTSGAVLAMCVGASLSAQIPLRVPASEVLAATDQPVERSYGVPSLSVSDAVRLTLLLNPEIWASREDLTFAFGQLEEARGNFDSVLTVNSGFSQIQTTLAPSLRLYESNKRLQLQSLADGFERLNLEFRRALSAMALRTPDCPPAFDLGGDGATTWGFEAVGAEVDAVCAPATGEQASIRRHRLAVVPGMPSWAGHHRSKTREGLRQTPVNDLEDAIVLSGALFTRARLAFDRLGPVPAERIVRSVSFDAGISKALRNGLSFTSHVQLQSTEQVFQDKPKDPLFGGLEVSDQFTSLASMTVNVPLGKGRGRVSAGASERFAELASRAQREQLRHVVSEQVFRAVLAYVNLVAAQDRLRLLEESLVRQEGLVELTEQLSAAGDVTLVEIGRANARAAQMRGEVLDGQLSVLAARIGLAQVMGLEMNSLAEAPLAVETFADVSQDLLLFEMSADQAVSARRDLKALQYLQDASRVFAAAAESDLKRRIDLSTSIGLSSLYESPFFAADAGDRDLTSPGVADVFSVHDSPVHYYSPSGFVRAFGGGWNPFASVSLTFELPFGNNRARGLATQARSSRTQSDIESSNLERFIREAVVDVKHGLERSFQIVQQRQRAVSLYQQTLENALQLFEGGEVTLIDALLSEQDLTVERLSLVRSQQVLLSLVARQKFENGGLVGFEAEETDAEMIAFDPFGLVMRE